jgi:hypothetical protein
LCSLKSLLFFPSFAECSVGTKFLLVPLFPCFERGHWHLTTRSRVVKKNFNKPSSPDQPWRQPYYRPTRTSCRSIMTSRSSCLWVTSRSLKENSVFGPRSASASPFWVCFRVLHQRYTMEWVTLGLRASTSAPSPNNKVGSVKNFWADSKPSIRDGLGMDSCHGLHPMCCPELG